MSYYSVPRVDSADLGEGFIARTSNLKTLAKYNLLGQGPLHYVNTLSNLVEDKKEELPAEDWEVLSYSLKRLMIDYEDGELYYYLVETYGAEALNYNTWLHFSDDCIWTVCVRTFTDMPTDVIEEYGLKHWESRSATMGKEGNQHVMDAIYARTDVYGSKGGLPPQMVRGILFNEELADSF